MFKRAIALLLIFLLLMPPLFADAELSYTPYGEDEFPIWTMKLRRAESLFFGSMVITLPVSMAVWSLLVNNNVIKQSFTPMENFLIEAGIASGLSLAIATADWIIGEVQGE